MNERKDKRIERNESQKKERCGWVADLSEGKLRYILNRRGGWLFRGLCEAAVVPHGACMNAYAILYLLSTSKEGKVPEKTMREKA